MKNKILRRALCLLLCLFLLPAFPAGAAEPRTELTTPEEFLAFAEACRLDSYSQNLVVSLEADLDLTGLDFESIPIFCGIFLGNGHWLRGIALEEEGSSRGLFRYLTQTALVRDLRVEGRVLPAGSQGQVGGIAGSNEGRILNCTFSGQVAGGDRIGGIAGVNGVTGIVEDCRTEGVVYGDHFAGGIAGENLGLIRGCTNEASLNATPEQNEVDLTVINIETFSAIEAANTVTDIGGIAGTTAGVIRDCTNRGSVGYIHIGYNMGGIAGSQQGYIAGCRNEGPIFGRKDVGGIAGQMEPVTQVEFSPDTLQILQGQLAGASAMVNQASANARGSAASLNGQIGTLQKETEAAMDALSGLLPPEGEKPELPDLDSILAAQNALTGSLTAMQGTLHDITASTQGALGTMSGDVSAIADQIRAINQTLSGASSNLGGTVTDVSDADTPEDLTGKVEACTNTGPVDGDLNAGGIAGSLSWENDLDPEDDLQFRGSSSLNFSGELRAVLLDCTNRGTVTVRKRCGGGAVGRMGMGLVKGTVSTGSVLGEDAEQVGGIAGESQGFIRRCSAKSILSGSVWVGGIAGTGSVVSDCRAMVDIARSREKSGAILGQRESTSGEEPVRDNYYVITGKDPGGIDGVSYRGLAEPADRESFLAQEGMEEIFSQARVTFLFEDGSSRELQVRAGEPLPEIPEVPPKEGYTGLWEGLEETDLEHVYFDRVYTPLYTPLLQAVRSGAERRDGRAVLLAQGQFRSGENFSMEPLPELPAPRGREVMAEGWYIPKLGQPGELTLRYAWPEEQEADRLFLLVRDGASGTWQERDAQVSGTYLVFSVFPGEDAFCLGVGPRSLMWLFYAGGGVLLGGLLLLVFLRRRSKRRGENREEEI